MPDQNIESLPDDQAADSKMDQGGEFDKVRAVVDAAAQSFESGTSDFTQTLTGLIDTLTQMRDEGSPGADGPAPEQDLFGGMSSTPTKLNLGA